MGLLDKMFGGGTSVEVQLDVTQVPVGGILSGRAVLRGGKKDLTLTSLNVRLLYVHVEKSDDSPLPNIDTRMLLDNAIAANQTLPAESESSFPFQFQIPAGTEPTAHNVSYQVMVVADIPKVKDPSAKAELKVIEGGWAAMAAMNADELYNRWPALRGTAERPLIDALHDMYSAIWQERESLIVAEPLLANLVRNGVGDVRRQALETWAHLLDDHARPENLQLLNEIAAQDLDRDTTLSLIEAAAKFADEGAMPLVARYAQHQDPHIRREVARKLRFAAADQFNGKRELLLQMAQDQDNEVRAAAYDAFSDYREDPQVMQMCAQAIDHDPSPDVQKACIGVLCFGHHHNMLELTLQVYERHLANQYEAVREEIADNIHWLPAEAAQRIGPIVQRLLQDPSEEVRRKMAWQFRNLDDFPSLAPLLQHSIQNDPAERVRMDGLGALTSAMPVDQAVAYYQQLLQSTPPTEKLHWALLDGVRWKEEPSAKQLCQQLTQSPFSDVARNAREALEND